MKSDVYQQGVLAPADLAYPAIVKELLPTAAPLYYKGNLSLLKYQNSLSVVGSRAVTATNEKYLNTILGGVHVPDLVIVSGLAIGMDALAHRIALRNGMPTIAIPGSGLDWSDMYPRQNVRLAEEILQNNGLLLSPFAPLSEIRDWNFPLRNQYIAALSRATLVASAALKSGALITARFALDYGKDVFVIPGPLDDPLFEGNNKLFQQGATPILGANDLLLYFNVSEKRREYATDNADELAVITLLKEKAFSVNDLAAMTKFNAQLLNTIMTRFEIRGWITILPSGEVQLI